MKTELLNKDYPLEIVDAIFMGDYRLRDITTYDGGSTITIRGETKTKADWLDYLASLGVVRKDDRGRGVSVTSGSYAPAPHVPKAQGFILEDFPIYEQATSRRFFVSYDCSHFAVADCWEGRLSFYSGTGYGWWDDDYYLKNRYAHGASKSAGSRAITKVCDALRAKERIEYEKKLGEIAKKEASAHQWLDYLWDNPGRGAEQMTIPGKGTFKVVKEKL